MRAAGLRAFLLVGSLSVIPAAPALADSHGGVLGKRSEKGSQLGVLTREDMAALVRDFESPSSDGPWYEFGAASVCGGLPGSPTAGNQCLRFNVMCQSGNAAAGLGPPIAVWIREVDESGSPVVNARWQKKGDTCFPELMPGSGVLTMDMIREAFHETDFALPTLNIQPEGDVTLVNLPTYFEVRFPEGGFGPNEVDTPDPARLLGYRIEVRPVLKSVTYQLGATTVGPTTSLGGPHPTGDVRATYTRPGQHEVRADIVYTGQFRVGGSQWFDIPGEVDLRGEPVTLTVREAKARLYTG